MPMDRFLIAPINTGLQKDLRPWLIPDDAFERLDNSYVFRGRVRKRFGGTLTGSGATTPIIAPFLSRLRLMIGTTNGTGDINVTILNSSFAIGQSFTIGNQVFTVVMDVPPYDLNHTGAATVATFNTTTGELTITGATINSAVYFYPGLPVMGLTTYEQTGASINDEPAYAFDTQWAYRYNGTSWERSGVALWHGNDTNFFWAFNWRGVTDAVRSMFVSNYHVVNPNGAGNANDDPIWFTSDGTTWTPATGANGFYFAPNGGAPRTGPFVVTARLIIGFKDRLIFLNTIENDNSGGLGVNTQYVNRARFSKAGSPFSANAWYNPNQTDNAGTANGGSLWAGANALDAPTDEAIISADFIKDRLIVFFERSTWELAYTRNQSEPFTWQKINTELGCESTFSTVPFDRHILTMGSVGVHACNGANVERIDTKIPDVVFDIRKENSGTVRVFGIRDYYTEMVYWTYPSDTLPTTFSTQYPNKVLVYNYRNGSWAINDDTITAFGYFNQETDETWNSQLALTWADAGFTWAEASQQAPFRSVIAGNQEGYVFIVDADSSRNAPVLSVYELGDLGGGLIQIGIRNHNLKVDDVIAIENAFNDMGVLGFGITPIMLQVTQVIGTHEVVAIGINFSTGQFATFTGTYTAGASATYVSNIQILSKQFNPYVDKGRNVFVSKIEFAVWKTSAGQITVDYQTSTSGLSMVDDANGTGALLGNNILETSPYLTSNLEQSQNRLWHPIYFQSQGECIQLNMYFERLQWINPAISWSDFQMEAMLLHTQSMNNRLE